MVLDLKVWHGSGPLVDHVLELNILTTSYALGDIRVYCSHEWLLPVTVAQRLVD
jgi:hypothetical protein